MFYILYRAQVSNKIGIFGAQFQNIVTNEDFAPWREEAIKRGYSSSAAIPLVLENTVIGVLNIYASEANAFNEDEVNILVDLAEEVTFSMKKLRSIAE